MNTADIISKLRTQAAELTRLAYALEAAEATHESATNRYLIHGPVKVGDWTPWGNVPAMSLVEDTEGDHCFKAATWRDWVHIKGSWNGPDEGSAIYATDTGECLDRCRVIALSLTGEESGDDIRAIVERFNASREANT
jgi:hypothetical protein